MMRALWTGASGMRAQQTSVDTISNNLANVNTVGYKAKSTEFKSLLYQDLQSPTTSANGDPKPTQAQVGLGTRVAATKSSFATGIQQASDNPAACFIDGTGFFGVQGSNGQTYYTRDGDFNWTIDNDGARVLTNNNGLRILDTNGRRITVPNTASTEHIVVDPDSGAISYKQADGTYRATGPRIGLWQF